MGTFKVEKISRAKASQKIFYLTEVLVNIGIHSEDIHVGGSYRRGKLEIGDLDMVIVGNFVDKKFYQTLVYDLEKRGDKVIVKTMGDSQASLVVNGFLVEFKKALAPYLGAMMLHVTGSGNFNIGIRSYAKAKGFRLNQYGLWRDEIMIACETEKQIFKALGLEYAEPWQRKVFEPIPLWKTRRPGQVLANYESSSTPGKIYRIILDHNGFEYCDCPGWRYRKTCKHMEQYTQNLQTKVS